MGSMRLEVDDLAFGYPERLVGRGACLHLVPGEILCLLGPNGCGKTTLFKTMLGLLTARSGRVMVGGENISSLSRQVMARRIAYVPQTTATPFPYTAHDVVLMGRVAHRGIFAGPSRADREIADRALDGLGVAHLRDRDVTRLSGGQRQLVMIARALAQETPLIVLDEPTASLDFGNQVLVLSQLIRLAAQGVGLVLSTHNPDHALAVADRVVLMHDGSIVMSGRPHDVITPAALRAVYGVEVEVEAVSSGQTVCVPIYDQQGGARS